MEGNAIGTAPASNPGWPNQIGVHLANGASENFIGGATLSARNDIVSTDQGILLTEPGTTDNAIQGNYIRGTGTPVGPAQTGILVRYSVPHNVIGGAGAGAGNSITQIQGHGVHVEYSAGPSAGIEICPLPQDFSRRVAQLWRVAAIDEDGGITKEEVLSLYPNDDIDYVLDYWFLSCDSDSDGYFRRDEGPCLNIFESLVRSELDPRGDGIISWLEARGYMSTEVFDAFDIDHDLDIDCHDIL